MKHYTTINEVKKDLPNILERIKDCKIFFDCATIMLKGMQDATIRELTTPEAKHSWWASTKAYAETIRNQMDYLAEIEYLQGLLKKLPGYKDNII